MFVVDVSADGVVYVNAAVGACAAADVGAAVVANGGADADVAVSAAVVGVAVEFVVGDGDEMLVGEIADGNFVLC